MYICVEIELYSENDCEGYVIVKNFSRGIGKINLIMHLRFEYYNWL